MTGMFDELWPLFLAEVTEQLDALELALVKKQVDAIDVDNLFRLFHTIKSSCGMLDFKSMEEIAHTSEDLLDLARKGERTLSEDMIDVFVDAVDALKDQLHEVSGTKANPEPRHELVSTIRGFIDSGTVEAGKQEQPVKGEINITVKEYDQLDRLLKSNLCSALCPFVLQEKSDCKQSLVRMRNFFDLMELDTFSLLTKKIIAASQEDKYFEADATLRLAADLLEQIDRLQIASGRDFDVGNCRSRYIAVYRNLLNSELSALGKNITGIFVANDSAETSYPGEVDSEISSLLIKVRLMGLTEILDLLCIIKQLLKIRFYEDKTIEIDLALLEKTLVNLDIESYDREQLAYVIGTITAKISNNERYDFLASKSYVEWSAQCINKALWDRQGQRVSYREADETYDKGGYLFEIYTHLESDQEFATAFVTWLYANSKVITNAFVDSESLTNLVAKSTTAFLTLCLTHDIAKIFNEGLEKYAGRIQFRKISKSAAASAWRKKDADSASASSLRVDSSTLDSFVSRIGEMVTMRNTMLHIIADPVIADAFSECELSLKNGVSVHPERVGKLIASMNILQEFYSRLLEVSEKLDQSISHIQEDVFELRVVPMGLVFNRLPKMVRKLSRELNKDVALVLKGEDVKVDKSLVDILMEPLSHLVRNSLDHGIEHEQERIAAGKSSQAVLTVSASSRGNHLTIEISDDGRGLQKEKIIKKAQEKKIAIPGSAKDEDIYQLIFYPGFSTSDEVTETSGRGVGMDAVMQKIASIGGSVEVHSRPGQGVTFQLRLPLSVAVKGILVVESAQQKFAIPEKDIMEVVELESDALTLIDGQCGFMRREVFLPLYRLDYLLGFREQMDIEQNTAISVVVIGVANALIGLSVSGVHGLQEIYVQEVDDQLLNLPGFGGASILGDGSVVVILDSESLLRLAANTLQPINSMIA